MTHGSRRVPTTPAAALGALVLTGSLAGCSGVAEEPPLPTPATTVHADPGAHTVLAVDSTDAVETYAPFLVWKDHDTLGVTTYGSSTRACWPVVRGDTVDKDGAYRAVVDLDGEAGSACTDDLTAQDWVLPVPDGLGSEAVIRLQLAEEPQTAYEYPLGDSRPD